MSDVRVVDALAKGGLILTRQTKDTSPGAAAEVLNYEVDLGGGFRRIDGYERFDGKSPPSSGWPEPWEWDLGGPDGGTAPDGEQWNGPAPVTGNLNEAVTLCIPLNGLSLVGGLTMPPGGEFALLVHDGNMAHYTDQVYTSQQDFLDAIVAMPGVASAEVTGGSLCITSDVPMIPGVYPRLEVLQWIVADDSLTEESLRQAISGPPGYGPIYGVATYKGIVIVARNFDEAGNDSRLYRSTPNGWEQIPMPADFVSGGAVASATATTLTHTAAGWTVDEHAGRTVSILTGAGTGQTRVIVSNTADTLTVADWDTIPDGTYEILEQRTRIGGAAYNFVNYNFYGDPAREGLYGADGRNKAFEIKGTPYPGVMEYTEIDATVTRGIITYYPKRVAAHAMHLFLAFEGGWVQYSGIGDPFSDDVNDGAGGIAYAGEITNMLGLSDNSLAITTRDQIFLLYGTSEQDWQSTAISVQGDGVGALPNTAVAAAGTFMADPSGIFRMQSVQTFGNYATTMLSKIIQPLYTTLRSTMIGACPSKDKGQYRIYYQGGEWISMTFGADQIMGFGYGKLDIAPNVIGYGAVGPTPDDLEDAIFIGGADGMVYRMDSGDTFDGADIPFAIRFHFHDAGNMRQMKRWRKAVVEFRTPTQFPLLANVVFDYGSPNVHVHDGAVNDIAASGGVWNVDEWGEFFWLGKYMSEGQIHINGQGRSVGLMLYGEGRVPSFVIEGYTLHYSPRRLVK